MRWEALARLIGRAMQAGPTDGYRRLGPTRHEWDISGSCLNPMMVEHHARRDRAPVLPDWGHDGGHRSMGGTRLDLGWTPGEKVALSLTMRVPCRAGCEACRRYKRNMWADRAKAEMASAARTWWGTLTFAPECSARALARAQLRAQEAGLGSYEALSDMDQFRLWERQTAPTVTLFLKRIREYARAREQQFKYLIVAEATKRTVPHYHLMLFERFEGKGVPKAELERQWAPNGFSHWRLVWGEDVSRVHYLCKYIAKDTRTRVRASERFGEGYAEPKDALKRSALEGTREGVVPSEGRLLLDNPELCSWMTWPR